MQILSGDFLAKVGVPVINIRHSFLPAFARAGPYEQARERGVKLIDATVLQAALDVEMSEHLVYEKGELPPSQGVITATAARRKRC
jgi:folate-dependent phosphoribosylglycinamide formyltransferase PurN